MTFTLSVGLALGQLRGMRGNPTAEKVDSTPAGYTGGFHPDEICKQPGVPRLLVSSNHGEIL